MPIFFHILTFNTYFSIFTVNAYISPYLRVFVSHIANISWFRHCKEENYIIKILKLFPGTYCPCNYEKETFSNGTRILFIVEIRNHQLVVCLYVVCLSGNSNVKLDVDLTPEDIAKFKMAPLTSCDVERSFSQYKAILRDNRRGFSFENFRQCFVTHCFLNRQYR